MISFTQTILISTNFLIFFIFLLYIYLQRYNRQMSLQSRRGSNTIRKVLKQIISQSQNIPPSTYRADQFQKAKLTQAVNFLQKKINRQQTQIKMLSDQLSKQISLKQQILEALNQEKDKTAKLSQQLNSSHRTNAEIKKKLLKLQNNENQQAIKDDFQIKLSKYRDIVRKKDDLIYKTQQKLDEMFKQERNMNQIQSQLRHLRQSFSKLKQRQEILIKQTQNSKKKIIDINQKLSQKIKIQQQLKQSLLFAEQKCKRLNEQIIQLNRQALLQQKQSNILQIEMKQLLDRQNQQIKRLGQISYGFNTIVGERPEWNLQVFKSEAKRVISLLVKDNKLRNKIQKEIIDLLKDVQAGFNNILSTIFNCP